MLPHEWLSRHINSKEMHALYQVLRQFCARYPEALRRAQVLIDVDNQSVVGAFKRGQKKPRYTRIVDTTFRSAGSLRFHADTEADPDGVQRDADAIWQPWRESIIRLHPDALQAVWNELGPFSIDFMASTVSIQRIPRSARPLPCFSQCDCAGSSGVDVLVHNVSRMGPVNRYLVTVSPSPAMVGHILQHLAECEVHAVIVVPDTWAYWFALVQGAAVRSLVVAPKAGGGVRCSASNETLQDWRCPKWAMRVYEVDFRRLSA